ncbi:uncharacterized protein [Drosophila takahashii]|uniref:uncharacterized protein isoform X2 n=1 Tax=Drosophila takahashii TaxID=29030 RepID=UPI003898F48B
MKIHHTTENWGFKEYKVGKQSGNGLLYDENKDEEMTPPPPHSEIPSEGQSNHCEFSWRYLIIVAISLILTLTSTLWGLFYEDLSYTSTKNYRPLVGALIFMYAINLMICFDTRIFRRSSSKNILMALYTAGLLCTRPFCIPPLLNIQKMIDGQYEMEANDEDDGDGDDSGSGSSGGSGGSGGGSSGGS